MEARYAGTVIIIDIPCTRYINKICARINRLLGQTFFHPVSLFGEQFENGIFRTLDGFFDY